MSHFQALIHNPMIYYPSKGKFEGISIPSISDSFTLLIDYYGINFLVLDGQATRPKPLVFSEPGFSAIPNFPSKSHFSYFGSPQHSLPKRRALSIRVAENVCLLV
jgi:hypothetical protein